MSSVGNVDAELFRVRQLPEHYIERFLNVITWDSTDTMGLLLSVAHFADVERDLRACTSAAAIKDYMEAHLRFKF